MIRKMLKILVYNLTAKDNIKRLREVVTEIGDKLHFKYEQSKCDLF